MPHTQIRESHAEFAEDKYPSLREATAVFRYIRGFGSYIPQQTSRFQTFDVKNCGFFFAQSALRQLPR